MMKNLLKNKKLLIGLFILLACALAVGVALLLSKDSRPPEDTGDPTPSTVVGDGVDVSDVSGDSDDAVLTVTPAEDNKPLTPDESVAEQTKPTEEKKKAEEGDKPVAVKPVQDDTDTNKGITVGDSGEGDPYHCGSKNHHCSNEYTHATIENLELEGCPTCGSHSCPSFYALDEWGNTLYTPGKCPAYSKKNDPSLYCQTCGKKAGDGTGGTCVFYITDTDCTSCGKPVKARVCHTCQ